MRNVAIRLLEPMVTLPAAGARSAARWLNFFPKGLQPLSLTGAPSGVALTVACTAVVMIVAIAETFRPGLSSLGSLLFLPVLVTAWLVGAWQASVVAAVAVATRMFGHGLSGVDLGTALSEAIMIVVIAVTARLAANSLVNSHVAEARLREQAYILESLEQREKIAAKVNDAAIRRLFGLSITLQALSELVEDAEPQHRLTAAIKNIDGLCADLRSLVFAAGNDGDSSPVTRTPLTRHAARNEA